MNDYQWVEVELPRSACPMGYGAEEIGELLAKHGRTTDEFYGYIEGQTGAICDGQRWDPEKHTYVPTECASLPHGFVVYKGDLRRFLSRRRVLD